MRGRISYVTIVGYISLTFIKILVDHEISRTRPYFFLTVRPFLSLLPHYVFLMMYGWTVTTARKSVRPGIEAIYMLCSFGISTEASAPVVLSLLQATRSTTKCPVVTVFPISFSAKLPTLLSKYYKGKRGWEWTTKTQLIQDCIGDNRLAGVRTIYYEMEDYELCAKKCLNVVAAHETTPMDT